MELTQNNLQARFRRFKNLCRYQYDDFRDPKLGVKCIEIYRC